MSIFVQEHKGKELTAKEMYSLVENFYTDLGKYASYPFPVWFDIVKNIPYINDDELLGAPGNEITARPYYLLNNEFFEKLDCKKKAILIASWAKANNIPYRFIAVAEYPNRDIHHVFPQFKLNDFWVNMDATLGNYSIGMSKPEVVKAEELVK